MGYNFMGNNVGEFFLQLDFNLKEPATTLEVKQYDSCLIRIHLTLDHALINLGDTGNIDFALRIKRPDGRIIFNECVPYVTSGYADSGYELSCSLGRKATMITGTAYADVAEYIPLPSGGGEVDELLLSGNGEIEQENDYIIVSSQPFLLKIVPSPGLNGDPSIEPAIGEIVYNDDDLGGGFPVNVFQPYVDLDQILHLTQQTTQQ